MKVGLVLGGGGVVGLAYHAAALTALENDLGWDPRSADVIVGTSAGSITGALLRRGIPASDLAALTVGAAALETPEAIVDALSESTSFPSFDVRRLFRLRPPSRGVVQSWLRRPWRVDLARAWASVIADGDLDLAELSKSHAAALGDHWPEKPLWVCAVRQHDIRRVVLGRDLDAPLPQAVAASCAVPGYFCPVKIGRHRYFDGGAYSPTNADTLRHERLDLVLIVSPMSGRDLPRFGLDSMFRRYAGGKLRGEVARLHEHEIPAVVLEPGPETAVALGDDFMSDANLPAIIGTGFLDAGEQLQQPFTRTLLAGLRRPRSEASSRAS